MRVFRSFSVQLVGRRRLRILLHRNGTRLPRQLIYPMPKRILPQSACKVNSAVVSAAAMAIKKACSEKKSNELFLQRQRNLNLYEKE